MMLACVLHMGWALQPLLGPLLGLSGSCAVASAQQLGALLSWLLGQVNGSRQQLLTSEGSSDEHKTAAPTALGQPLAQLTN